MDNLLIDTLDAIAPIDEIEKRYEEALIALYEKEISEGK